MNGRLTKIFLPILVSLFFTGSFANTQALAKQNDSNFNFPSCESLLGTPGDIAHYDSGTHQIVGGSLLQGSDNVYSQGEGNFVQCFCPQDGSLGIQTNWLRTNEPIDGWFFENGLQWNLGNYNYAAQNSNFSCHPESPSPQPSPGTGGGGPSQGGVSTPTCPQNGPQQIDQVWFTDVKPNEVTVNWANKGDASGFHIAYGPSQNDLIWGVDVNDHNASQFTLQNLPGGDLWVAITAKASADCGGPTSKTYQVGGPQVLGATGVASSTLEFAAGFALIALGIWQAQNTLAKRGVKQA